MAKDDLIDIRDERDRVKIYFSKGDDPEIWDGEDPGPLMPPQTVLLPPEEVPDRFHIDKQAMDEWIAETGLMELKQRGLTFHLELVDPEKTAP